MATMGKGFCIITGASKGFGRAIACELCRLLEPGSVLLLVARSGILLQELKEELRRLTDRRQLVVHCVTADLGSREGLEETVRTAKHEALADFNHVLLINNAGSLGNISRFDTFSDINAVNSYLSLNVSSALALTAGILQVFPCRTDLRWTVVNVSSMFALMASPSWVLYCTAKAARMMLFNVLAQEEPNVKVLSYSPGPMDTEMQEDIKRLTGAVNDLNPCHVSAAKLMKLLLDNDFSSGTHLDFFDV